MGIKVQRGIERKEEKARKGGKWGGEERMKKRGMRKSGGRNNTGRITVRHRGGGAKRNYREIEYTEGGYKEEITGKVIRVEYDPNRTAWIGECENKGKRFYKIIGGEGAERWKGEEVIGKEIRVKRIKEIGVGEEVYKVSMRVGQEGKIGRATGARCRVLKQGERETVIRMPSGEVKGIGKENKCTIGSVYGPEKKRLGKAGRSRRLGIRPTVRGVAMNAVDHPNGGKTAGGGQSKTK